MNYFLISNTWPLTSLDVHSQHVIAVAFASTRVDTLLQYLHCNFLYPFGGGVLLEFVITMFFDYSLSK